jgi:hypothetical protein
MLQIKSNTDMVILLVIFFLVYKENSSFEVVISTSKNPIIEENREITSNTPTTLEQNCCQHPHHLTCIVNTTSATSRSCQHSHHLECGVTKDEF